MQIGNVLNWLPSSLSHLPIPFHFFSFSLFHTTTLSPIMQDFLAPTFSPWLYCISPCFNLSTERLEGSMASNVMFRCFFPLNLNVPQLKLQSGPFSGQWTALTTFPISCAKTNLPCNDVSDYVAVSKGPDCWWDEVLCAPVQVSTNCEVPESPGCIKTGWSVCLEQSIIDPSEWPGVRFCQPGNPVPSAIQRSVSSFYLDIGAPFSLWTCRLQWFQRLDICLLAE